MTDQPALPDDLEPEDLLPEDVEGPVDPVTLQPNPTDDLWTWQQKANRNVFDQPAHPPTSAPDDR
jgi:hypothetical protein